MVHLNACGMPPRPDPSTLPCGVLDETGGLKYFPRMVQKIRLHQQGRLWEELHQNLGKAMDRWMCGFLHLNYDELKARVLDGGSDEELLQWCQEHGRPLNETDKLVWNSYAAKLGWNDHVTPTLHRRKIENGLEERADIVTMAHYMDVDEGRRE